MKKNDVKFTIAADGSPILVFDMTIHGEREGKTYLAGKVTHNGKFAGVATMRTTLPLLAPRKRKGAPKAFTYLLAHRLAVEYFTGGKSGIADSMVMDLFSINDAKSLRSARQKADRLPKGVEIAIVGDSLKTSGIAILENPNNLKVNKENLEYAGSGIAWVGADQDVIIQGDLYIKGWFDGDRLIADFSGKKLAPEK